jgi:uncharacterized protein
MKSRRFGNRWIVRIDRGEEIVSSLRHFCRENQIRLGAVSGIGATNQAVIGSFKTATQEYFTRELTGDMEITNLTGNISSMKGEVYTHLHITLSDAEYKAWGGHLSSAVVSGTLEAVVHEMDGSVEREFDDKVGLNLYKL